ncbi:MAG TPA: DUF420 domain-containing protein [Bacteroidetes bacterium]|nr:DUF420 domain-containing protein [Bacteroidota bacterium]
MTELQPNIQLEKKLNRIAWAVTVVVIILVSTMHMMPKFFSGYNFTFLPAVYSSLNALTAIILIAALYFIKKGNMEKHRAAMTLAMVISALFMIGYVVYHLTYDDTKFGGEGAIRYVYFFMLITHIIAAGIIFPFILFTYIRAYTNQFAKHKKMAKWVYWVWLYVAVTGPVLFLMIRPYYPWT